MSKQQTIPILAIDGGGTHCRLALVRGQERNIVLTGPANVFTEFEGAVGQLNEGLKRLALEVGVPVTSIQEVPTYVGLAGLNSIAADELEKALPFKNARYADDRPAALRGALGEREGIIAHCGTGSFFASQLGGVTKIAGGWGAILGDEASAQWVGRKALAAALRQTDGLEPHSTLLDEILHDLGGADGVMNFANQATPHDFGKIAPKVTASAKDEDPIALRIMQEGADIIAYSLEQMGWTTQTIICLTGGIAPYYTPYLPKEMQVNITEPLGDPLEGAIALAYEFNQEVADENR